MAINPLKALLFTAGGVVAAAETAYVSGAPDPDHNRTPPSQAAALEPCYPSPADTKPDQHGLAGPPPAAPDPST